VKSGALLFAGFAACAALFLAAPEIDLLVSRLFWRPGEGFFLRDWLPFRIAHDRLAVLTTTVSVVLLAAGAWWLWKRRPVAGLDLRGIAFLLVALIVGPGLTVNTLLKDNWGRARPVQVREFGGTKSFGPPLIPGDQCERNCSFVAGDPALGFWFLAPALLLAGHRRRLVIAGALGLGSFLGLVRIAQGGHFLSDVVFCFFAVAAVVLVLHRLMIVPAARDSP
jgi:lipid A 4'-phosphatase